MIYAYINIETQDCIRTKKIVDSSLWILMFIQNENPEKNKESQ